MQTESLKCSGCGAPLVPGQTTSIECQYCRQLNYVRPSDALGPMAEVNLSIEGANARFTDELTISTSAPACLGVTSMVGSSITGSLSISLSKGDLRGQVLDMSPSRRTGTDFIINLIDMTVPTTYTNMVTSMSAILDPTHAPDLGGQIRVTHFDLHTGQTDLELIDIRLAKLQTNALCRISGTIRTFRSVNPIPTF